MIGSGPRAGEAFAVTVDTQISALLEFASGPIATAMFSFDAPIAFRELEVQGTEAVIRLPDPNRFDGSVLLYRKDANKVAPDEWLKIPTETDWAEIPADGSVEGRGMGVLDMARALRSGGKPRASADLAVHVLDVMESITGSAASAATTRVSTNCISSGLLPTGWDPLERSA